MSTKHWRERLNRWTRMAVIRATGRRDLFWRIWGYNFADEAYQRRIFPQHEWLRNHLAALNPASVAEVGCGFGRNLGLIRDWLGDDCLVVGFDFSLPMLARARDYVTSEAGCLCAADAIQIPMRAASADVVLSHGLLMHLPDAAAGVAELLRVARRSVLIVEQWDDAGERAINDYTWVHDYEGITGSVADSSEAVLVDSRVILNTEQLLCLRIDRHSSHSTS